MYQNLSPGTIGIRNLPLPAAIELAKKTGFGGVEFNIREVATLAEAHGLGYVRELFDRARIRPGHWGLPVDWRGDNYESDLAALPRLAGLGRDLGCDRTTTGMQPSSDDRPYAENFAFHVGRLRPIAEVLRDQGCRVGIEFIGPKTLRVKRRYEFIYTLRGLLELSAAIGVGNVGVLLDIWHLYTAGEEVSDFDRVQERDIVVVHVNDAPPGIPRDEQIDNVRALPMETGVLPLAAFMQKLTQLGYGGPVTPEPFSKRVNDLASSDPEAAARLTAESMRKLWETVPN
jgi:sugar phosphate isomerase/epimerase